MKLKPGLVLQVAAQQVMTAAHHHPHHLLFVGGSAAGTVDFLLHLANQALQAKAQVWFASTSEVLLSSSQRSNLHFTRQFNLGPLSTERTPLDDLLKAYLAEATPGTLLVLDGLTEELVRSDRTETLFKQVTAQNGLLVLTFEVEQQDAEEAVYQVRPHIFDLLRSRRQQTDQDLVVLLGDHQVYHLCPASEFCTQLHPSSEWPPKQLLPSGLTPSGSLGRQQKARHT